MYKFIICKLQFFLVQLQRDKELLQNEFCNFLFDSQLNNALKPYDDMSDFLQSDSISILEPCRNLRKFFGVTFTDQTVKTIMSIRTDLNKDIKRETISACRELIDDYNIHNPNEEEHASKFLAVLGVDDEDEMEEEKSDKQKSNSLQFRKARTMRLSIHPSMSNQITQDLQSSSNQSTYIEEGYLLKRLSGNISFDHRYFRLKKGKLFWFINDKSLEAQNKLDLTKVEEVTPDPSKDIKFAVQLEDGKVYEFKTENKDERDIWVASILHEQQKYELEQMKKFDAIKTGAGKHAIIKDYDYLARQERKKQQAEERRLKRLEREREVDQRRKMSDTRKKQNKQQGEGLSLKNTMISLSQQNTSVNGGISCCDRFMICLGLKKQQYNQID